MKWLKRGSGRRQAVAERRGVSSFELVAAFSLLVTAMASTMPLYVRHQRLLSESRRERVALEELANLAERIAAEGSGAVERLSPSPTAQRRLPGVKLMTEQRTTTLGERVILSLRWNETGRRVHPLQLAVWLPPAQGDAAAVQPEEGP